jgi:hypothetical protein
MIDVMTAPAAGPWMLRDYAGVAQLPLLLVLRQQGSRDAPADRTRLARPVSWAVSQPC